MAVKTKDFSGTILIHKILLTKESFHIESALNLFVENVSVIYPLERAVVLLVNVLVLVVVLTGTAA